MKGWERDLLDHLAWFTVIGTSRRMAYDEALIAVERELPLAPRSDPALLAEPPPGDRPKLRT
jgi:hypothetical protein